MSLLDTASLIVTPNGYKEGKLYSVIPSDGSGDFSVTRATTATRVNAAGLVELVPYNLFQYSEQFNNAAWTKSSTTITANTTTSPNGTLTADLLYPTSSGNFRHIRQNSFNPWSGIATASIYVKAAGLTNISILDYDLSGIGVNYNLATGVATDYGTNPFIDYSMTHVGDGWYRCTATALNGTFYWLVTDGGSSVSVTANGTDGVYIWGAQLVEGTSALDYQKTETRLNIPRLDYSLGSCPNILLEPQRTNLALRSEEFDNAAIWTNVIGGTGVNPIRTANAVTSPSGIQNADTIVFDRGAGNTINDQSVINQQISIATTGTYYFTVWLKATASGDVGKQVLLRCGTAGNLQAVTLTANWVRYEITASVTAGSNIFQIGNRGIFTNSNSVSVDLWGAQLEAGAYATSYIPTTSASVTRNQDVITRNNIFTNGFITSSGGTWFVDIRNNRVLTRDAFAISLFLGDTASANTNSFTFRNVGAANSRLVIAKRFVGNPTELYTTLTDNVKAAFKWNGTTADIFINGVKVVSATEFTATALEFLIGNAIDVPKYINSMALFPTPLTDTQCIALTTL